MDDQETQRALEIINTIRNARADLEQLQKETKELIEQRDKLEDQIEGYEDDIRTDEKNIEELEQELIELTRSDSEDDSYSLARPYDY